MDFYHPNQPCEEKFKNTSYETLKAQSQYFNEQMSSIRNRNLDSAEQDKEFKKLVDYITTCSESKITRKFEKAKALAAKKGKVAPQFTSIIKLKRNSGTREND